VYLLPLVNIEYIYLDNAPTASYEPFNKSNELAQMMHAKIIKPSPGFEPPTHGTVRKPIFQI
jgi:hypothetical protein